MCNDVCCVLRVVVELDANYTVPEELSDDEGGEREVIIHMWPC